MSPYSVTLVSQKRHFVLSSNSKQELSDYSNFWQNYHSDYRSLEDGIIFTPRLFSAVVVLGNMLHSEHRIADFPGDKVLGC